MIFKDDNTASMQPSKVDHWASWWELIMKYSAKGQRDEKTQDKHWLATGSNETKHTHDAAACAGTCPSMALSTSLTPHWASHATLNTKKLISQFGKVTVSWLTHDALPGLQMPSPFLQHNSNVPTQGPTTLGNGGDMHHTEQNLVSKPADTDWQTARSAFLDLG